MDIINPFHVAQFESFGNIFILIILFSEVLVYLAGWLCKLNARQQMNISMFVYPVFSCWMAAIFYWYFNIIIFIISFYTIKFLYKVSLTSIIKDETKGITGITNRRREEEKNAWISMSVYDREVYILNFSNKNNRKINFKLLFIISLLCQILIICILNLCGYHYRFF